MEKIRKNNQESGQILLIIVMLLSVVITVVLAVSFTSRSESQITKLEEENQKALDAAEAGVESALKKGGTVIFGQGELSSIAGYQGQATVQQLTSGTVFTTPLTQKDDQYTFYLGAYSPGPPATFGASTANNIRICFGSSGGNPAIEVTLLRNNAGTPVKRYVIDPGGRIANSLGASGGCPSAAGYANNYIIPGADISTDSRFMVVRVLYAPTYLTFSSGAQLPSQGTLVNSTVTSATSGVTKKLQLFQSYPQIPTEFFSASF
jgi:type II secretory pathway pseudopilin PulG